MFRETKNDISKLYDTLYVDGLTDRIVKNKTYLPVSRVDFAWQQLSAIVRLLFFDATLRYALSAPKDPQLEVSDLLRPLFGPFSSFSCCRYLFPC